MAAEARDIDRKLAVTAALVGARTRKDLAAAFRRANPRTSFDVERANKWLQGRSRPREQQIYEDWAAVLDLGRGGAWIADCLFGEFLEAVSLGREEPPEALLRRARAFGGEIAGRDTAASAAGFAAGLAGLFVGYSHAWSPYLRGRLVRSGLRISPGPEGRLTASYSQVRRGDRIEAEGPVEVMRRALLLTLREPQDRTAFQFTLFPPVSLVSVLGGLMAGPAILGADPQPSVSRILFIRLSVASGALETEDCILDPEASVAADLKALGLDLADPEDADRRIRAFLSAGGGAFDHVRMEDFRGLVELLDREWYAADQV